MKSRVFTKSTVWHALRDFDPWAAKQRIARYHGFWVAVVTISPHLLQKSHSCNVDSSHRSRNIRIVHAAPVRCLPPPGASPAAAA